MKSYPGGIRHDYNVLPKTAVSAYWRHWSLFGVGAAIPLICVAIVLVNRPSTLPPLPSQEPAAAAPTASLRAASPVSASPLVEPAPLPPVGSLPAIPKPELVDIVVRTGDTLESIFRKHGLRLADLAAMASLPDAGKHLRILRPGDSVHIAHDGAEVLSLQRALGDIDMLTIERDGDGFKAAVVARDVEYRVVGGHGKIESSLFEAGTRAGISDAVIMNMAGIFQWDIDFIQDVRVNDRFTVLYQELWRDGIKLRDGPILAAEFVNRGQSYRAARYTDRTGHSDYYTPEGRSVRKAFIRAPVDFTRISDSFNLKRKHPILNTIRAHRGVDYAAPTGTPVRAAGDGKIIQRGPNGSFGNSITLQHGGNITTVYAHLSRFANLKLGSRVKQGQTIGYVGQTGLATGPHLHYEYRVNGVHRDPRTVALPPAEPVSPQYQEDFQTVSASLWSQLDVYKQAWLSSNIE